MQIEIHTLFLLLPPLLLIEGLFSGSEIALLSADKLTLKRKARAGDKGAKIALELATHPERVLSVTLLMTCLCVTAVSALIALYCLDRFGDRSHWIAVALSSPLIVLLGELIPKTIYQGHADRIAPWAAYPVSVAYTALYPVTRTLSLYTSRVSRMIGPIEELLSGKRRTTREELRSLMSYGKRETEIKSSEKRMIKRIFDFADTEAKHALIPLVKVEAIEDSATVREALERFDRHRHSRVPVYSDRIDNIVGVLESSDLFGADLAQPIRNSMSSAHYIAETQSLDDLMADMHREDLEMVVVVDEHGGAVGILTLEDIVEEIVGEIRDEYDQEARLFKEMAENHWLVQARMEIDAINDQLKIHLPQGDYETLSGFLLQQFSRIPEARDELFFNTSSGLFKFTIRQATERAIQSVEIEKIE
jgi:CBS domain containing-hemolysin-like protein